MSGKNPSDNFYIDLREERKNNMEDDDNTVSDRSESPSIVSKPKRKRESKTQKLQREKDEMSFQLWAARSELKLLQEQRLPQQKFAEKAQEFTIDESSPKFPPTELNFEEMSNMDVVWTKNQTLIDVCDFEIAKKERSLLKLKRDKSELLVANSKISAVKRWAQLKQEADRAEIRRLSMLVDESLCLICQESWLDKPKKTFSCGHVVCAACLVTAIANQMTTCPFCRRSIANPYPRPLV